MWSWTVSWKLLNQQLNLGKMAEKIAVLADFVGILCLIFGTSQWPIGLKFDASKRGRHPLGKMRQLQLLYLKISMLFSP